MKVAVCLSSLARSLWYTWPVLKEYVVNELNADVFLHKLLKTHKSYQRAILKIKAFLLKKE